MKVLVTGATGLIGRNLCSSLTREGHEVVVLSRSQRGGSAIDDAVVFTWDPMSGPPPPEAMVGLDAVVHLAGEPVAGKRWSAEQKRRIRDSRIIGTRNLVVGIAASQPRVRTLVSASAVGYYGDRGAEPLDESSAPGHGFLAETSVDWEQEANAAVSLDVRVVKLRIGVVLSAADGALKKMLPAFKLGLAGPLGSGKQWFPWIHIDDLVGLIRFALDNELLSGPVNGTAPSPVTNAEFTRELGKALNRPAVLPAPPFALRLAMGEMAEVVLASQRVLPKIALGAGYRFKYPELRPALENLLLPSQAG